MLLNVFKYYWYGSSHFLLLKYFIDYLLIQFVQTVFNNIEKDVFNTGFRD